MTTKKGAMLLKGAAVMDDKGRLVVPVEIRRQLNVNPGDAFYFKREGGVIMLIRAENPFDVLAREGIREFQAGRTVPLGAPDNVTSRDG
jgi:AbrB family looped-hinge helix DNA binding protein